MNMGYDREIVMSLNSEIGAQLSDEGERMFSFLKKDPVKKMEQQISRLYEQAVSYQRNGKLREYAEIMSQIDVLQKKIDDLVKSNPS